VALAAAALLLLAVAIPSRLSRTAAPEPAPTDPAASMRPNNSATGGRPVPIDSADAKPSEAQPASGTSGLPTLSPPGRTPARPGSPPAAERAPGAAAAPRRIRAGGAVKAPFRIVNVNPVYPEEAKAAGIQGSVILDCVIGVDGSVSEAAVIESVPELDQAAIDAVLQWVYEPTLLNGEPVEVEMTVTVTFTLR
jgi:protein TonB